METTELMSPEEEHRLQELETIIKQDLKGFMRVGMALKEIKESKLYRGKYTTWKDYLKTEWDLSKAYANYQIQAFNVIENLKRNGHHGGQNGFQDDHHGATETSILPQNERQARPLTLLPQVQQVTAWEQAVQRTNGKVTALAVSKVVEEILEQKTQQQKGVIQRKVTKEVDLPDDFAEAFRVILSVLDKHRLSGWKGFKRKRAIEAVQALEGYLKPSKA